MTRGPQVVFRTGSHLQITYFCVWSDHRETPRDPSTRFSLEGRFVVSKHTRGDPTKILSLFPEGLTPRSSTQFSGSLGRPGTGSGRESSGTSVGHPGPSLLPFLTRESPRRLPSLSSVPPGASLQERPGDVDDFVHDLRCTFAHFLREESFLSGSYLSHLLSELT